MINNVSGFYVLLRARDHVISNGSIPLDERLKTVDLIDGLTVLVARSISQKSKDYLCPPSTSNLS